MLVPGDLSYTGYSSDNTYDIFTIDELVESVSACVNTYYDLLNSTVGNYMYMSGASEGLDNDTIRPVEMRLVRYKDPSNLYSASDTYFSSDTYTETYYLIGSGDVGPFANWSARQEIAYSMSAMYLTFAVRNMALEGGDRVCYVNEVKESYHFYLRGRIQLSVEPSVYLCGSEYHKSLFEMHFVSLVMVLLAVIVVGACLQYLHIKAIIKNIRIYQLIKQQAKKRMEEWKDLSWRDKLEFFNVCIIGSAWCCRYLLFETKSMNWYPCFFFIGIGCMFSWISMIQYLEQFPHYYFLILTLKTSSPRVLAFVVGVLPIFIGFACFGVAYFATSSSLFSTIDEAAVTLFSLLNGDSIHDVFDAIYSASPIISRIYLYTFIALFIYAVLNIFIAIVEDAFMASRQASEKELEEDLQMKRVDESQLD
ncbi:hypothetical protein RFI_20065, partial [Reticulomyxa filosa]